jgi:hypothetical protein
VLKVKNSTVNRSTLTNEMKRVELVAEVLFSAFGVDAVITSANDSTHKVGSLHYKDQARDFRSKHIAIARDKLNLLGYLKKALGPNYTVLLENSKTPNEHFHIEFDPPVR